MASTVKLSFFYPQAQQSANKLCATFLNSLSPPFPSDGKQIYGRITPNNPHQPTEMISTFAQMTNVKRV